MRSPVSSRRRHEIERGMVAFFRSRRQGSTVFRHASRLNVPDASMAQDRDSHIIASLQRGLTRREVALRLGVRYWVIAKAARRWEMAGGAPLPRSPRGRPRWSLHTVTDRERDVVADYRSPEHPTMEVLGARYGISKERVRQLIVSYELKTGDKVLRVTAHLSRRRVSP